MSIEAATRGDAPEIARVQKEAADHLTALHGCGPWSSAGTERGVLRALERGRVLVARAGGEVAGSLQLTTRKPWAIDVTYFQSVVRPLYLINMAVVPARQRLGAGRQLLAAALDAARAWPADAVRLDAYDAPAGAGGFYARCGFREVGRASFRGTPLVYLEHLC